MSTTRPILRPAIACVLLALAMTSTAAAQQDLRSPDARDAAAAARQDLRSPDARDAAAGRGSVVSSGVSSPQVFTDEQRAMVKEFKSSPSYQATLRSAEPPQPAPVSSDGGIDWGDAAIVAGGLLGLIALGFAGAMAIVHRRHRGPRTPTVA